MFEENGRINTNTEQGNKKINKEIKVTCLECGEEILIIDKEFGEKQTCPECGKVFII